MDAYQRTAPPSESADSHDRSFVPLWKDFLYLGIKIAVIFLILWGIFTFIFGVFRYNSNDMSPSLKSGDLVFTYRLDKDYISGDVVAIKRNGKILTGRVSPFPEKLLILPKKVCRSTAHYFMNQIFMVKRVDMKKVSNFRSHLPTIRFFSCVTIVKMQRTAGFTVLYPAKIPLELLSCSCGDVEYKILVIRIL